jgi:hypothetical protein
MTKNQKIALGCGGAGCLGLIVVAIAAALIYFLAYRSPARSREYNINTTTNGNSNSNDNSDFSTNTNDNSSNSNSSSDSTMSKDDKHKLYYAALLTADTELIRRVMAKLDLLEADFTEGAKFRAFVEEHTTWTINNMDFIQQIDTPEKARAYVNEHISE